MSYSLVERLLMGLKNWSMYSLTARCAWLCVANRFLPRSSHSSVLKKLSATALYRCDHGPFWSRTQVEPTRDQIDRFQTLFEDARGWPLPALMAWHSSDTTFAVWETNWGLGLACDQGQYGLPRALPLRPIIGGFLVNWIVFAVVSYLVLYRIAQVRCHARLGRKRCVVCGYPTSASPVCTECGEATQSVIPTSSQDCHVKECP